MTPAPSSSSSSSSKAVYAYKPGGSLKFKGGESVAGSSRKKHKKSRSSIGKDLRNARTSANERRDNSDDQEEQHDVATTATSTSRSMTAAERKFEETRRKRLAQRVEQKASLSHKDRVDQFNKALADRTEHNDMLTVAGH